MTESDPGSRYVAARLEIVASAIEGVWGQIQRAYLGGLDVLGRDPRLLCTGIGHRNGKLRGGHPNIDVMEAEGRIEDSLMLFTSTVSCSTDSGRDEHVIAENK